MENGQNHGQERSNIMETTEIIALENPAGTSIKKVPKKVQFNNNSIEQLPAISPEKCKICKPF